MNLPSYARGLLTELETARIRKDGDHESRVRAELDRVIDEARSTARGEVAALEKGDPQRADYDALFKALDEFQSSGKPARSNTKAAAAPEKA